MIIIIRITRGGSRVAATSKMERFVIIVHGFQPLTIITKRSILDVAAALDPPLDNSDNRRKNRNSKNNGNKIIIKNNHEYENIDNTDFQNTNNKQGGNINFKRQVVST